MTCQFFRIAILDIFQLFFSINVKVCMISRLFENNTELNEILQGLFAAEN